MLTYLANEFQGYSLVYFWCEKESDGYSSGRWKQKRYPITEIPKLIEHYGNEGIFTSMQIYGKLIADDTEKHYMPICFDFDSDKPETAISDVRRLYDYFISEHWIEKEYVHLYFSGSKGFHLVLDPRVIKLTPHQKLTYIVRQFAFGLRYKLGLDTMCDRIYSIPRLWRYPDSIHPKSKLYKVELDISELADINNIREIAQNPRGELYPRETYYDENNNLIAPLVKHTLNAEFLKYYYEYEELERFNVKTNIVLNKELALEKTPLCIRRILTEYPFSKGNRNKATMVLANWYRTAGVSEQDAQKIISDWAYRIPQDRLQSHTTGSKEILDSTQAVVSTVFRGGDQYNFVCNRAKWIFVNPREFRCPDDCILQSVNQQYGNIEEEQKKEIPEVHFSDTVKAENVNKTINTNITVIGKKNIPFIFPRKVTIKCKGIAGNLKICSHGCSLVGRSEHACYIENNVNRDILKMIDVSDIKKNELFRKLAETHATCKFVDIIETDSENIEEIRVIPQAETETDRLTTKDYVSRSVYYIGSGIKTNESYKCKGILYNHPKTQSAIFIVSENIANEDTIDKFELTPAIYEDLKVFQAEPGNIYDKFYDIHTQLEPYLSDIVNRKNLAMIMDLVYHSTIGYYFNGKYQQRGWLEALIVGDTRTGKSKISEGMIRYYGIGKIIVGENLGRTGLLYNLQQMDSGTWFLTLGEYPRADRRMIFIDEADHIDEARIGETSILEEMSSARSTGILSISKVVGERTNSRVRMVLLSNTKENHPIKNYGYGCQAIKGIVHRLEDVARVDLFATPASGEVAYDIINVSNRDNIRNEHEIYTKKRCNDLIKFAWTRQPRQIRLEPDTVSKILELSKNLAKKYPCSTSSLPLLVPEDLRYRLARLSIALATRLFSANEKGEVIVLPEHVEAVTKFLVETLDTPVFGYNKYVEAFGEYKDLSDYTWLRLKTDYDKMVDKRPDLKPLELLFTLREMATFLKTDLETMMGYKREEINEVMFFLTNIHNKIYNKRNAYYRRTPRGTEFINRYLKERKLNSIEDIQITKEEGLPY